MKCFECGGEVLKTLGTVKMTRSDGSLIIFKGIPMTQCRQCGEQYISGKWSEKIGELMRQKEALLSATPRSVKYCLTGFRHL